MNMLLGCLVAAASAAAPGSNGDRASEVMQRVRESLGGEAKLTAVKSLSLEGEMRRVLPAQGGDATEMSGGITVDTLLPDRYLKVESLSPFPGAPEFSVGMGMDGGEAWRAQLGGGGPGMIVRMGGPEGPAANEALRRRLRGEQARLLLLAMGSVPEGSTLTYAGEAEAPEGKASLIDVAGPDGFAARLFVDAKTNRPLMLTYKGALPRMQMMRAMGPAEADRMRGDASTPHAAPGVAAAPGGETEIKLFVSDFRSVGGVVLPHKLSQSAEGGPSEEWQIKKWKVNPELKPDTFRKKN